MKITFFPQKIEYDAKEGETVIQAALNAGAVIDGNCGGLGTCGKCKIKILRGDVSCCEDPHGRLTENEKKAGIRLACCHKVSEGMELEMAEAETTAARKRRLINLPSDFNISSDINKYCISLGKPSLSEQMSEQTRIKDAIGKENLIFSHQALVNLAAIPKNCSELTLTVSENVVIDIEKGNTEEKNYGVAVDIGTTTVVVMLWNLNNGEMIDVLAATNPQGIYGADVISRISFIAEKSDNLCLLQNAVRDCINREVIKMQEAAGIDCRNIYKYVVVGNTTMSHIFLGINPSQLAVSPFNPIFTESVRVKADALGIYGNSQANVDVIANIAGHVGSDITAGIITTQIMDCDRGRLFIDIGTNGEIVLSGNGRVLACSTAAGPAFEGSSIKQGMRASRGAIERVNIFPEGLEIFVIGDDSPIGICGSGIIDAVGEMVRTGILDRSGRILGREKLAEKGVHENILSHIREDGKANEFVLFFNKDGGEDIAITQKDVREIQLAKAAISAGIDIMMKEAGISCEELQEISIAGAFGNYIRISSAIDMGLLPKLPQDKIFCIGNSAGIGASMALLSKTAENNSELYARRIEHIELAARTDFQESYIKAMKF